MTEDELISSKKFQEEYDRRMESLENMPGGAQGAHPNMQDWLEKETLLNQIVPSKLRVKVKSKEYAKQCLRIMFHRDYKPSELAALLNITKDELQKKLIPRKS